MNGMPNRASQGGVVLAVVLILLLVMTLLAVASLSGTVLEERMSTAQLDRNLSMQAAEAALREAEAVVRTKPTTALAADDDFTKACALGLCAAPANATQYMRWSTDAFWANDSGTWAAAAIDLGDLVVAPRYVIELMDADVPDPENCTTGGDVSLEAACTLTSNRYRVTVRSAAEDRAVVMLQSIYVVP